MQSDKLPPNPREAAGLLSSLMFCFALPILFKGRKKTLQPTDLYQALKAHRADSLGDRFFEAWQAEVAACRRRRRNQEPSIIKVIVRVFGWQLLLSGLIIAVLELGSRATAPLLLGGLISEFTAHGNGNGLRAQLFAAGLILTTLTNVLIGHPQMLGMMHLAMKMRVAVGSAIYRKALRLSRTALGDTTTGQVVNLISNDLGRFDRALIHFHFLWVGPLELLFASYFLYQQIGLASLYGIGLLLLYLPGQTYLSRLTSTLRLQTALRTDQRVRMMNEIISGIQVIKMYTWERPFGRAIEQLRRSEMSSIRKVNYIRGTLLSFEITLGRCAIFVSLLGYVLMGGQLTAEKAFVVTAFYNILRRTVCKFFPNGMSQFAELLVTLRRIRTFLMRDETESLLQGEGEGDAKEKPTEVLVEIEALTARWSREHNEPVLDKISMRLKRPQLVAVIGPVGSGKSSLIQAILGELPPESGAVRVQGRVSYASQEPWLFNASLRDNILFGLPMDKHRYRRVIQQCALERDFELLQGDRTVVGERGASLSGGQRARISLARAVYRSADIYLLDDPLSAVDTHVGRHLFEECMRGFLRHQLVILVTHQLQFLQEADLIVIMDKGRVTAMGSYEEMLRSGQDFAQLLAQSTSHEAAAGDGPAAYSRQSSCQSRTSVSSADSGGGDSVKEVEAVKEVSVPPVQESRSSGKIGLDIYRKYFGAGSGWLLFALVVFFCLGTQLLASGGDYFLSYWVKNTNQSSEVDIYYFSAINVALVIFAMLRTVLFFSMAMHSSTQLHNSMFQGVSRTALYFFHSNPLGRILNRFAMDLGQVDEVLPAVLLDCIQLFLTIAGIICVLCITNPWYLLNTFLMFLASHFIRRFYLSTSRDVKRLEAVARSPMYSHFSATLNGLPTIRALGGQRLLTGQYDNYQDLHSSGYYTFLTTSRAFGYYLDLFCVAYVVSVTLTSYFDPPLGNAGQIGLAITQAMSMTGTVQWGMRQSAELENSMTSVERVVEYRNLQPEGEFESPVDKKPSNTWPKDGEIVADNMSLRYNPDPKTDRVLKSLNFVIQPREKIGIVGRTGAGKSTLINALFRLSYTDGTMLIDGQDTAGIGLHDLRSKISIIPQEPVLFSGTLRYNLDPFEQFTDEKLWQVLEEVHLKEEVSEMPSGLQSLVSEGGTNYSVGQRQLVCLARAILRENRILVMDEATANVDPQTDALIQSTIRRKFRYCTVLTIAHRLNTIIDSDRVMVLDAGHLVEFGTPQELLMQSESKIFHGMVMETGRASFDHLLKIAQSVHESKSHSKSE